MSFFILSFRGTRIWVSRLTLYNQVRFCRRLVAHVEDFIVMYAPTAIRRTEKDQKQDATFGDEMDCFSHVDPRKKSRFVIGQVELRRGNSRRW
jgi:hypothetical protein